jgi:hypothetical protein
MALQHAFNAINQVVIRGNIWRTMSADSRSHGRPFRSLPQERRPIIKNLPDERLADLADSIARGTSVRTSSSIILHVFPPAFASRNSTSRLSTKTANARYGHSRSAKTATFQADAVECRLAQDRGIDRTSTTRSTRDVRSRSTNFRDRSGGMADGEATWRAVNLGGRIQSYGENKLVRPGPWAHGRSEKCGFESGESEASILL